MYAEILYSPVGKTALMNGTTLTKAFVALPGGGTAIYNSSGLAYYRHADWLGSSRLTSTQARGVYSTTAYAPFGEQYATSGTADPSFTGQNSDTVSSLYDFLARRQSPSQGRWISPDPAGLAAVDPTSPQTWNRYAYVANNSLSYIDPYGTNLMHPCWGSAQCNNGDTGNPLNPAGNGTVWSGAISGVLIVNSTATWIDTPGYPAGQQNFPGGSITVTVLPGGYWDTTYSTFTSLGAGTPQGPSMGQGGGNGGTSSAPSNGPKPNNGQCSVLDPNCKPMGPVAKYLTFLQCENLSIMETITEEEDGQGPIAYGFINAGALAAIKYKQGNLIGLTFVATASIMDLGAVAKANATCTNVVYGH